MKGRELKILHTEEFQIIYVGIPPKSTVWERGNEWLYSEETW